MEPFPNNAVAFKWEFRCNGGETPGHTWDWRCLSKEGAIVARSQRHFRSLREAVADANARGFNCDT